MKHCKDTSIYTTKQIKHTNFLLKVELEIH